MDVDERALPTRTAAFVAAVLMAIAPVTAFAARPAMLNTLERGLWTLRVRDSGSRERICVRSGMEFIQLRHRNERCSRYLIRSTPDELVVQYTCRGEDYGRTTIRRESAELVQIQSRGVRDGRPFALSGEARLAGRC